MEAIEIDHDLESIELFKMLPSEQVDKVFNQDMCDIEPVFLGFVSVYKRLSEIIPHHYTVVDLGCAYNAQSFYFTNHKKYIAVDQSDCIKFCAPNCEIVNSTVSEFIKTRIVQLNLKETFAICSYVPPWGGDNMKMVRDAFINVFTYYPHGGYSFKP